MKITDEIIEAAIKNANKDQYGQIPTMEKTIGRLFPNEDREEVKKHLETSPKYRLSTYGWKYGTYQAIALR